MPKKYKISCTGCGNSFTAVIARNDFSVTCPECGKQIKIKRKQHPDGQSRSQVADQDDGSQSDEVVDDDVWDDVEDQYAEGSYLDDSFSQVDEAGIYGDDYRETPQPPPSKRRRRRKQKSNHQSEEESKPIFGQVGLSGRNLDDLTEGTYDKAQHFSAAGSNVIRRLIFTGVVVVVGFLVIQYLRHEFHKVGVDINVPKYGLVGFDEEPVGANTAEPIPIPSEQKIEESMRERVGQAASSIPSTKAKGPVEWELVQGDVPDKWDLSPDPVPTANLKKIVEISRHQEIVPVDFSNRWVRVEQTEADEFPMYVDLNSMKAKRLDRQRFSETQLQRNVNIYGGTVSPDGTLFCQRISGNFEPDEIPRTGSYALVRRDWTTLHKFDNTLIKVFPDTTVGAFLSDERMLLAGAQQVRFYDITTDKESASIAVKSSTYWRLSPGRRYLVVIDAVGNAGDSEEHRTANGKVGYRLRVFNTANGDQEAERVFYIEPGGVTVAFSQEGDRLAIASGFSILLFNMTDGAIVARGRVRGDEETRRTANYIMWLDGGEFLYWRKHIISTANGLSVGRYMTAESQSGRVGRNRDSSLYFGWAVLPSNTSTWIQRITNCQNEGSRRFTQ